MSTAELDYIELLENKNLSFEELDTEMIMKLAKNKDSEIRTLIAEVLSQYSNDFCDDILLAMLDDNDEMVRCNACDSLGSSNNPECVYKLIEKFDDESELVRCYAILGATDITLRTKELEKELENKIRAHIKKEKGIVKIAGLSSLVLFGYSTYLNRIFKYLSDPDYHIQIFTIKTLRDVSNKKNRDIIIKKLLKLKRSNTVKSVNAVIEDVISDI